MLKPATREPLPADVAAFIEVLNSRAWPSALQPRGPSASQLGTPDEWIRRDAGAWLARAPGRMDVMGGIADYSGSLVLQMPIREAALAACQVDTASRQIRLLSLGASDRAASAEVALDALYVDGDPIEYDTARRLFAADPATSWSAYLAGAFVVLMRERGARFGTGCRIVLDSRVPEGKGVSSSAAIEVASMLAVAAAYGIELERRELALLCQKVENLVVGAACGVMDQMTAACGARDQLMALLCQPAELLAPLHLPDDLAIWGIDSGIRHSVAGDDYTSVRTAAFMGLAALREITGNAAGPGDPWKGYLANVTPQQWKSCASRIPERISGKQFLERYGGIADTVTRVDATREYAVRAATEHPIFEHQRHRAFAAALGAPASQRRNEQLGEWMLQTHSSYSRCGLGSEGTDALVAALTTPALREAGVFGAKITGGGSGGSVAVLARRSALGAVEEVAERYGESRDQPAYMFRGSSDGACALGPIRLEASD